MKSLIILITTVSLLLCPLRCTWASGCADAGCQQSPPAVNTADGCCPQAESDLPSAEAPVACDRVAVDGVEDACSAGVGQSHSDCPSDSACQCKACICQGALLESAAPLVHVATMFSGWFTVDFEATSAGTCNTSSYAQFQRLSDQQFSSGRAHRIAMRSLLI
ncbi:hypothetical protein SH139x_005281 [Planctomycetaceae bacterium SH139]